MPDHDLLSILLALSAALLFGISSPVTRLGLYHASAQTGSLISIGTTAALYWLLSPWLLESGQLRAAVLPLFIALFALIGLLSPGLSLIMAFEGNRRLGPTVSGTVASITPLFATAGAVLFLGERLTAQVLLGTLGIVGGVMTLSWRGRKARDWGIWVLIFPLAAATLRGGGHIGSKFGFELLPAPFTAALITFSVAFVVTALAYRLTGGAPVRISLRSGTGWFLLSGLLSGVAVISLYQALELGRVIVVSPIVSTYPLPTMVVALLLRIERLTPRILVGVMLVVAGVVAVGSP